LIALQDADGARTSFDYNAADQRIAQTGSDTLLTRYTLDAMGQPIAITEGANTTQAQHTTLTRDLLGRLCHKRSEETDTRYVYDALVFRFNKIFT
jgi:YD repeat-containing protein